MKSIKFLKNLSHSLPLSEKAQGQVRLALSILNQVLLYLVLFLMLNLNLLRKLIIAGELLKLSGVHKYS